MASVGIRPSTPQQIERTLEEKYQMTVEALRNMRATARAQAFENRAAARALAFENRVTLAASAALFQRT